MVNHNRRNRKKYPAIDPTLNLKTRYEEIMDVASYFHTLPEDAKEFMHAFVEESINAKFNHKGETIYTDPEDRRKIYNKNNARNRDVLTKAKACGKYVELDDPNHKKIVGKSFNEDLIIAQLDQKAQDDRWKSFAKERRKNKKKV